MNFMKNLKIGKKLIVTFGVIIILFLISLMVSIVSLNNSGKNFKEFYTVGYPGFQQDHGYAPCYPDRLKVYSAQHAYG